MSNTEGEIVFRSLIYYVIPEDASEIKVISQLW